MMDDRGSKPSSKAVLKLVTNGFLWEKRVHRRVISSIGTPPNAFSRDLARDDIDLK